MSILLEPVTATIVGELEANRRPIRRVLHGCEPRILALLHTAIKLTRFRRLRIITLLTLAEFLFLLEILLLFLMRGPIVWR